MLLVVKACGRGLFALLTWSVDARLVCHRGSPVFCRLGTYRPCTYPYLCLCLYPCLFLCRGLCPYPGLVRRRTSIWEAFDCAWLAMETAVKSGETVLPSYVVYPASRTCRASPS